MQGGRAAGLGAGAAGPWFRASRACRGSLASLSGCGSEKPPQVPAACGARRFQRFRDGGKENSAVSSSSPFSHRSMWEQRLPGSDSWPFVLSTTPWAVHLERLWSRGAEE